MIKTQDNYIQLAHSADDTTPGGYDLKFCLRPDVISSTEAGKGTNMNYIYEYFCDRYFRRFLREYQPTGFNSTKLYSPLFIDRKFYNKIWLINVKKRLKYQPKKLFGRSFFKGLSFLLGTCLASFMRPIITNCC